jgi:hypothetical protein
MEIGSECEPHHPSTANHADLRKRARIVLARNVCMELRMRWEWLVRDAQNGHELINQLIAFYAAHADHADLNERDLANVHEFLKASLKCKVEMVDAYKRIHRIDAVRALVATGAWEAILKDWLYEAIPWLCERLARAFGRPAPALTDRFWQPVLPCRFSNDLVGCIRQAGLSKDDLVTFSEEIRHVVALCGMTDGCVQCDFYGHAAERAAGQTLLELVSRVNHAVADLRDR